MRHKDPGDIRRNPRGSLVYFNQGPLASQRYPPFPFFSLSPSHLPLCALCRIAPPVETYKRAERKRVRERVRGERRAGSEEEKTQAHRPDEKS